MLVHEIYAHIYDGKVQNILVCDNYPDADYLAKCIYGSDAYAVSCLQYGCAIGDLYHDGAFWRVDSETGQETQIDYKPTEEQQVASLTTENEQMILMLADIIGGTED